MNLFDISTCYFKLMFPNKTPNKKNVLEILKQGRSLINNGWTYSNITNRIVKHHKQNDLFPNDLYEIIPKNKKPPLEKKGNILENKFYYHKLLQNTPNHTKLKINHETGKINKKSTPFYLEMKEAFTLKQLTKYFHYKMENKDKNLFKFNYKGFDKFLNDYSLDFLLFTIDAAAKEIEKTNKSYLIKYFQLTDYFKQGKKRFKNAKLLSSEKIKPYYKVYLKKEGDNIG